MLIAKHTVTTTASPKAVWAIWEDAARWPTWDNELEEVILAGPFAKGTTFRLKPKDAPWVNVTIANAMPEKSFLNISQLPLTKFYHDHYLEVKNGKTYVTHKIWMEGLLSWFFAFVIGRGMKKTLPDAMEQLVTQAEKAPQ